MLMAMALLAAACSSEEPTPAPEPTPEPPSTEDVILELTSEDSLWYEASGGEGEITYTLENPVAAYSLPFGAQLWKCIRYRLPLLSRTNRQLSVNAKIRPSSSQSFL